MLLARILTPHKLSLLILIWHCTLASKEREEEDEEREEGHYTSAAAATTRLDNRNASIQALYLALLEWIEDKDDSCTSGIAEPTLMQLLTAGDGEVQTNETTISTPRGLSIHAAAVLVENLRTLVTENDLYDLMETLKALLMQADVMNLNDASMHTSPLIEKTSPFGIFIRRCVVDFNSLLFETVARFFIALRQYTQQCTITFDLDALEEIPFILPGQEENDDDRQVAAVEQRRFQQLLPSVNLSSNLKDTISYYNVNRYMTHMVDMLENSSGIIPPNSVQTVLDNICRNVPDVAKVYYLNYLNYMRAGEFEACLDSLHQFFDYNTSKDAKMPYQYALLNLAVLHTRFHHPEESLMAIREAIEVARSEQDHECLSYSLSWLNRLKQPEFSKSKAVSEFTHHALGRERSGGGEPAAEQQQVLNSLIDQSRKNKLLYLQSLTELVRAKYLLKTGQSPVEVFAALHRSFALNTFHGIKGIRGSYHLLCANVWQLYGCSELALFHSKMQVQFNETEVSVEDMTVGFCNLSLLKCLQGKYDEAEQVLKTAKEKYGGQFAASVNLARSLEFVSFQKAINRRNLGGAQTSLVNLASLCDCDYDAKMEMETRTGSLHLLADSLPDAFEKLCQIVDRAREPGAQLHVHNVYALEKFADIQMDAGLPIHALSLVLSCLTMSEQFHLSRPQLASYLRLAKVLLSFRIPQTALKVVQDVMPAVLASEIELQLKADAYLMMGKCLLECVNSRKYDGSLYTFTDCIEPFKSALKVYSSIHSISGVTEASYLLARTFDVLGLIKERDEATQIFLFT